MPPLPPSRGTTLSRAGRFERRHMLMLALALEVLVTGVANADRYRRPGITVDIPLTPGHVIV